MGVALVHDALDCNMEELRKKAKQIADCVSVN
jgi:hypothetical protein